MNKKLENQSVVCGYEDHQKYQSCKNPAVCSLNVLVGDKPYIFLCPEHLSKIKISVEYKIHYE